MPPRESLLPVAIVLAPQRWSQFRFFGSYAEFGKELFGFVAKPLEHAHSIYLKNETVLFLGVTSTFRSPGRFYVVTVTRKNYL